MLWPGGPNAPGPPTRGPREIEDFVGWEMARGKAGRIRGPHEACFVGWIGARGPVGLFGRTSNGGPRPEWLNARGRPAAWPPRGHALARSDERRVGEEWRARWR